MTVETTTPRSRRAILAAALGAGAATIASALGRPSPVRAGNDGDVVLGGMNNSPYPTKIVTTSIDGSGAAGAAIWAQSTGAGFAINAVSDYGAGISASGGSNGVTGIATIAGIGGLFGGDTAIEAQGGKIGVFSTSDSGVAVRAETIGGLGVLGMSKFGSTGVQGFSGDGAEPPAAPANTGVHGVAKNGGGSGVQGEGPTTGVYGNATTTTAAANGVFGQSVSPIGNAVSGYNGAGSGDAVAFLGPTASPTGTAVIGNATGGQGVRGTATSGRGVNGIATTGIGVVGASTASTGVQGFGGSGALPAAPAKTGVFGYAAQDATSRGVTGQTTAGYGVSGIATTGHGVNGTATTGIGVIGYGTTGYGTYGYATTTGIGARGYSVSGTGGYFSTSGAKIGTALRVIGKVKLDNCAGVATIASGANSVVVTPGTDLLSTSAVVATLMGNPGGTTTVQRVAVNAAADTFTIYLTANATAAVTVAWIVLG